VVEAELRRRSVHYGDGAEVKQKNLNEEANKKSLSAVAVCAVAMVLKQK
jgi:hypothetical protein